MNGQNSKAFRGALRQQIDKLTYRRTHSMFRTVYRLFDQATMCFDAKAYDAVCIMCRSTLEAICYVALTRERLAVGTLSKPPMTPKGVRKVYFRELEKAVSKTLSQEQKEALLKTWERGDFIAHLIQVSDRKFWKSLRDNPNANPFDSIPKITEKEATESIENCKWIIPTIVKEAAKNLKPIEGSTILSLSDEQFERLAEEDPFGL